jgi:hypothetical protein
MKKRNIAIVSCACLALAACSNPQGGTLEKPKPMRYVATPDGCVVGAATVGTSADASFTVAGKYCRDSQGNWREMKSDGTFGPTVKGQVLVAVTGALIPEVIRTGGMLEAANRKCRYGGTCGGDVFNINGGNAAAISTSESESNGKLDADLQVGIKPSESGCGWC